MLARRVGADGRTRAYLNGRAVARRGAARRRRRAARLLRPARAPQADARRGAAARSSTGSAARARAAERLRALRRDARSSARARVAAGGAARARRAARARARPARVRARRDRLAGAGCSRARAAARQRASGCASSTRCAAPRRPGAEALAPDGDGGDERSRAPRSCSRTRPRSWTRSAGVDPALDALAERARALAIESQDLAGELRGYCERRACEERGRCARRSRASKSASRRSSVCMRKHGGSIERCSSTRERRARPPRASWPAPRSRSRRAAPSCSRGARGARGACARAARRASQAPRRTSRARCASSWRRWRWATPSFEVAARRARGRSRGRRRGRVHDRAQSRRARRAAAGDRLRRRALARDARDHERRATRLRERCDARLRRGRRRHRRAYRPRGRRAAARAGRARPGALHHPSAADRLARRAALLDRQGHRRRADADVGRAARRARGGLASWCGCSAPTATTRARAGTRAELRRAA